MEAPMVFELFNESKTVQFTNPHEMLELLIFLTLTQSSSQKSGNETPQKKPRLEFDCKECPERCHNILLRLSESILLIILKKENIKELMNICNEFTVIAKLIEESMLVKEKHKLDVSKITNIIQSIKNDEVRREEESKQHVPSWENVELGNKYYHRRFFDIEQILEDKSDKAETRAINLCDQLEKRKKDRQLHYEESLDYLKINDNVKSTSEVDILRKLRKENKKHEEKERRTEKNV